MSGARATPATAALNGDGFVDVFYYLWRETPSGHFQTAHCKLPDTLVYHFDRLRAWYFTSRGTGHVLRKREENLDSARAVVAFGKRARSWRSACCDVVAVSVATDVDSDSRPVCYVEHLSAASFGARVRRLRSYVQLPCTWG